MVSKIRIAVAAAAAVGVLGGSGAAIAEAASPSHPAPTHTSTGNQQDLARHHGDHGRFHGQPVTGAELKKITTAIDAKYRGVTIRHAMKTSHGTYVAVGTVTKNGHTTREIFRLNATLTSITEHTPHHRGGRGRFVGQPVTGAELEKITTAIDAKYSGVTIRHAVKTPRGTYVAVGTVTKNDHTAREIFRLNATLTSITEHTPHHGRHRASVAGVPAHA